MSISFIAIHSYILKYVASRGQNTLRGALYPTLPYTLYFSLAQFKMQDCDEVLTVM